MVILQILKRNSCLTSGTICRIFSLQDLISDGCRKYSMILKNTSTLSLWNWTPKRQSSILENVIPEMLIARILMPLLSVIVNKNETKPNQLSDSGMGCQSRKQVWSWNIKTRKNGSINSLKVTFQNQCNISSKKN